MTHSKIRLYMLCAVVVAAAVWGYIYLKRPTVTTQRDESKLLLAEISQKGLQKFIDDHNVLNDDVLFGKVCPLIESGQEEWVSVAAQIRYGNVSTHDAGFSETVDECLGNALDEKPVTVLRTIKNTEQTIYSRSRLDSSVVVDKTPTTASKEIARICIRTDYDFDDSLPSSAVKAKIDAELKTRKTAVESVADNDLSEVKKSCLGSIESGIRALKM